MCARSDAAADPRPAIAAGRPLNEGAALAVASDGAVKRRQSRKSFGPVTGDRGFESISLQRRVRKPSVPRERSASLQSAAVIHTKGTSYRYNRALSRFGRRKG